MKTVSVSIICKNDDANYIQKELLDLQLGLYSLGTKIEDTTEEEKKEVLLMTPKDIIEDYFGDDIDEISNGTD